MKASVTKTFTEKDIKTFAELSGDTNPLHLDTEFAKRTRFGRPIVHGFLTASLISAVLGTKLPGPGSIYLEQKIRFLKPVYIGDSVTAEVVITEINHQKLLIKLATNCYNQRNEKVVEGEAIILFEKVKD
ncbi:enoyl-CoA hydratase [Candidatus Marsarchaeota G1 archaeon OSP_D]|jgi:3-hydroxybutyryl-CoA dehydratase|uniref:Enoyl-CoA hydratase n=1 Tax=Candidatus Marsarchaeota G1 archaeon OSP_D TaxID=1978155 RepID=A0A2R6A5R5_9ARCH|nr:MAG: enoyl-CoA hydratase [Candidatus Marsarchaeota G1 archaeon OSP_D]